MTNFEKSFQELVDEAVLKAIERYFRELQETAQQKERLFTVSELSQYTGFSTSAIRNWITKEDNPLPAYQIEKEYRIKFDEFQRWIEGYKVRRERVGKLVRYEDVRKAL